MDKNKPAVDGTQAAAPEKVEVVATAQDDKEARIAALEAEKAQILEREANYKEAFLKEKKKNKGDTFDTGEETDEERIRRIVREESESKRMSQIESEKDGLLKELAKENKELKLAQLNKASAAPASQGTHAESVSVKDTLITQDQLNFFKSKGWSDSDIERYKKNLQKNVR